MKNKHWQYVLTITLFGGTIFAWYTVFNDFLLFYNAEGTFLKVTDCVIPNPVVTPCFYGAFAFLTTFIWSLFLLGFSRARLKINQKYLFWFMIGGTIFAWGNFIPQLIEFVRADMQPILGCSGQVTTNPFTTACFIGSAIFLLALIISFIVYRLGKKTSS